MSEVKAEWKNGRLYIDGEPLPGIFKASSSIQGSRISFVRLTPEESAVIEAAIAYRTLFKSAEGKSVNEWLATGNSERAADVSLVFKRAVDALISTRERVEVAVGDPIADRNSYNETGFTGLSHDRVHVLDDTPCDVPTCQMSHKRKGALC